jgi:hypothetical protein
MACRLHRQRTLQEIQKRKEMTRHGQKAGCGLRQRSEGLLTKARYSNCNRGKRREKSDVLLFASNDVLAELGSSTISS